MFFLFLFCFVLIFLWIASACGLAMTLGQNAFVASHFARDDRATNKLIKNHGKTASPPPLLAKNANKLNKSKNYYKTGGYTK